jgi:hypothetical protein
VPSSLVGIIIADNLILIRDFVIKKTLLLSKTSSEVSVGIMKDWKSIVLKITVIILVGIVVMTG